MEVNYHDTPEILRILLKDRNTKQNIIWASHSYEYLGKGYEATLPIQYKQIEGADNRLIQPRRAKSSDEQKNRTKQRAEVFTSTWLVNKQVGIAEEALTDLTFEAYIQTKWLEITCGEAPYIVSRNDVVTGEPLPLNERVGFLDHKLQRITEKYGEDLATWTEWAVVAYQSTYGYEFQGDSLFLARKNLFHTFLDFYQAVAGVEPEIALQKQIATIISYNLLQMDGLTYQVPFAQTTPQEVQLSLFDEVTTETSITYDPITIKDWTTSRIIELKNISSGAETMKFDVVIGNPPYQEEAIGENLTFAPPIYHKFMEETYRIGNKVCLITPARFLFNAGSTPKKWNESMLHDKHLKVESYYAKSGKVFPNTDIKGGVAITYHDYDKDYGEIDIFTPYSELNTIIKKIDRKIEGSLDSIISGRGVYKLSEQALIDYPEIEKIQSKGHKYDVGSGAFRLFKNMLFFEETKGDGFIQILGLEEMKRKNLWVDQRYLNVPDSFNYFKIFIPQASGSGEFGEILSAPVVAPPLFAATETFLSIGAYSTEEEAWATLKYIKTKFVRALLGSKKITQANTRDKWSKVPLQDFTPNSDIDWTQSIPEIDQQLYRKYGLSPEEIAFIEEKVRAMD